jgi:predicted MFS family arabinose efflux permease
VGLFLLPHVFAGYGLRALYVVLGVLGLCAAPLVRGFDPALGRAKHAGTTATAQQAGAALNACLVIGGVLAFYVAIGGVWTFASKAAALAGFDAAHTGEVLAAASVMGIVGAGCASFIGGRVARMAMLLAGYAILAVSLAALATQPGTTGYMGAVFAFKFAWTFVLPFILAAAAKHDRTGRLVASLNFVIGAGLAAGPLIAGVLLDAGATLATLFAGAAAISVISCVCLLRVERA